MKLGEIKKQASEVFSSILLFCPNSPAAAQTNTAKKFDQLTGIIDAVFEKISNDAAKQWLRICLQEVQSSRKHYEEGNRKMGSDLIQRAEEHFNNAFSKKRTVPRFVVGEVGGAQDLDTGFPA